MNMLQKYKCYEILQDDILAVQKAYANWEDSLNETPVDFITRKRKVDLSYLLNDVIENELTEIEQTVLRMYYYENLSVREISNELNIHRSTISRRLETANLKIFNSLKYVIKYQYDTEDNDMIPLALREAFSISAVKACEPCNIGGRILRLRVISNISSEQLSKSVGIEQERFLKIENGSADTTVDEIVLLAAYFKTSTDYLLIGANNKN